MKKVVLITGASSGIGKATADRLLSDGHIVYGAARSVDKMSDLKSKGLKVLKMDVTKENDLKQAVETIISEQNRIDVLFNNAGFGLYGSIEDTSLEDARYQFDVNLFGLARLTQLVLPHMRKQKDGLIINTSSMGGKIYTPLGSWYHATKHALEGWSDCLRIEVKQFGIRVVIVEPGAIETNFGNVVFGPALERSKGGAYEKMITGMMSNMEDENGNPKFEGSPPSVIADVVSKAIKSDNPKTRYVAGKMARPLLWVRKIGGDRFYDWFILRQFT